MIDAKKLKKKITAKFGTMSNFATKSGIDRYEIQKAMSKVYSTKPEYQELLRTMDVECDRIKDASSHNIIDPKKLEALKTAINELGGVSAFCYLHSGFQKDAIFKIMAAESRRNGPIIRKLLKLFQLE